MELCPLNRGRALSPVSCPSEKDLQGGRLGASTAELTSGGGWEVMAWCHNLISFTSVLCCAWRRDCGDYGRSEVPFQATCRC